MITLSNGFPLQLSHLQSAHSHFPPLHLSQDFPPFTKSFTLSSFLCRLFFLSLHEQEPHLQCFSSLSQRSHLRPLRSSCLRSSLLSSSLLESSLLESSSFLQLEGRTGEGTGEGMGAGAGAGIVTMGPHACGIMGGTIGTWLWPQSHTE